ncbi:MAG: histidine kinase [Saprospiraceae bacterium]|nr:histidine kinase [Saprospiraceae bacterium]
MENSIQEGAFVLLMIIGILIMLALALAFILFFNYSQKSLLRAQMHNQKLAFDHQEELLHSTILTQEAERSRIATELHDGIGSKLNIILLNTHRLKQFSKENQEMEEVAQEINSVIHNTIDTTRRISHDLLPPTLEEFGLVEALKELCFSYTKTEHVTIHFDLEENEGRIEDHIVELNFFRVIQELIKNSITHGEASKIFIHFRLKLEAVSVKYEDNGKGFDSSSDKNKKGLGMKNIESRLNMSHATYRIESAPKQGFKCIIDWERKKANAE